MKAVAAKGVRITLAIQKYRYIEPRNQFSPKLTEETKQTVVHFTNSVPSRS